MKPAELFLHGVDGIVNTDPDSYLGSPMYEVLDVHVPALLSAWVLVGLFFLMRRLARTGRPWAVEPVRRYAALDAANRTMVWLVAFSGIAHLSIVPTHLDSFYALLFLFDGLLLLGLVRGFSKKGRWSRWLRPVLVGSILGYALSSASGEAPDQAGLLIKLVELTALAISLRPASVWRRAVASTSVVSLFVIVAAAAWAGAFQSGDGGHHLGETPPPGVLLPPGEDRAPSEAEAAAAATWFHAARAALVKYEDPEVAARDGFDVAGMAGTDFHADNPARKNDGHVFEPSLPETLVYAMTAEGEPVLLGAMYQMDEIGQSGPAVGGPLTVWHAHDHVCFSILPPGLAGLTGPWGTCPLGSITMPITNEMIHVWTIPGAPERFGELPEEWLAETLANW